MTYGWIDFDVDESTDEVPDKYVLFIGTWDTSGSYDEEVAVMVHRTVGGMYPLDGEIANRKRRMAQRIVDLLNEHGMEV